jgi:hypothetical protein
LDIIVVIDVMPAVGCPSVKNITKGDLDPSYNFINNLRPLERASLILVPIIKDKQKHLLEQFQNLM